jgi:hypothetical protein
MRSGAPDLHPRWHIPTVGEIGVQRVVVLHRALVLPVWQVFEQRVNFSPRLPPLGMNRDAARRTPSFIGIQTFSTLAP